MYKQLFMNTEGVFYHLYQQSVGIAGISFRFHRSRQLFLISRLVTYPTATNHLGYALVYDWEGGCNYTAQDVWFSDLYDSCPPLSVNIFIVKTLLLQMSLLDFIKLYRN